MEKKCHVRSREKQAKKEKKRKEMK
jgi:hypothetical protein